MIFFFFALKVFDADLITIPLQDLFLILPCILFSAKSLTIVPLCWVSLLDFSVKYFSSTLPGRETVVSRREPPTGGGSLTRRKVSPSQVGRAPFITLSVTKNAAREDCDLV